MGKTLARIENGVVVNLEWVNDDVVDTDNLKNVYDLVINIGDTYENDKFYRDGVEVITFRKQIQKMLSDYDATLTEIASCIPAVMSISNTDNSTIDSRKELILDYLNDMVAALETLEVESDE